MKTLLPVFAVLLLSLSNLSAAKLPNIMVFLIDDMGVMDTSVPFLTDQNGKPKRYPLNDYYRTPGMERLAKQGIRFNQFYAMSVCSPTRISIMTGQNAEMASCKSSWIETKESKPIVLIRRRTSSDGFSSRRPPEASPALIAP